MSSDTWLSIYEQKKALFVAKNHLTEINNEREFRDSLEELCGTYDQKGFPKYSTRLSPSSRHVESFQKVVAWAAKSSKPGVLIWSACMAVLQSACRTQNSLDNAIRIVADMNESLPLVSIDPAIKTIPDVVKHGTKELYCSYLNFCLDIIKYLSRNKIRNMLSLSSPRRTLVKVIHANQRSRNTIIETLHALSKDTAKQITSDSQIAKVKSEDASALVQLLSPRYSDFTGRSMELKMMHDFLFKDAKSRKEIRTCILHGIGGIGKSETAVEYAHANKQAYPVSWLVTAEEESKRVQSFCQLAQELGLMERDAVGNPVDIDQTRKWLEKLDQPWLLIFDNVEEYSDILFYLPTTTASRGSVIITTQNPQIGTGDMKKIEMESLSTHESAELLSVHLRLQEDMDISRMAAESITELVGGLPLFIAAIGGFIKQGELTLEEFLRTYEMKPVPQEKRGARSTWRYQKTPQEVLDIAQRNLPEDAARLLDIFAFLDADAISDDLLVADHDDDSLEFLRPVEKAPSTRYFDTAYDLRDRTLVKREKGGSQFRIHRSLQQAVRHKSTQNEDPNKVKEPFRQAFWIVRRASPAPSPIQVPLPSLWNAYQKVLPHIKALENGRRATQSEVDVNFARLISDAGINMWERGLIKDGIRLLHSAESILDKVDKTGEQDLLRASIHVVVSLMIQFHGISQRQEALDRMRRATEIRLSYQRRTKSEDYTRNDDILMWNAQSDLACTLLQFNDFAEAEPIFDKCLQSYKIWDTPDAIPFEYAKYNHHKGHCQLYHGKVSEAQMLTREGWRLMALATGEQSSMSYRFQFDHACVVLQNGNTSGALRIFTEVLEGRKKGTYEILTLQCLYAVGAMHDYLGDYEKAEWHMNTALDRAEKASWPQCAVARGMFHLSLVLGKFKVPNIKRKNDLETKARLILNELLPEDPLHDVHPADELALFDHLQSVYDGRFTSTCLLKYLRQDG